jgi:hypothetical protein
VGDDQNLWPWRDRLKFALVILLAPVWMPLLPVRQALARRRWRRFHRVERLDIEGAVVAVQVNGAPIRVQLRDLRQAVASGWGDGSNGTDYEAWLVVDDLRLRGSPETLSPLKAALAERGLLRDRPWTNPHPLAPSFDSFGWAVFGGMLVVYAIGACFLFVSKAWALAIVAGIACFILSEQSRSR